ncbi:MAG: DNA adenine methylase [Vulcanisaeta sp.]|nr:DNA adenine methylase [Vulcanisaeta sp.]MCG2886993.1 DNA adenine methylase [Vulcanisaeta sp.]
MVKLRVEVSQDLKALAYHELEALVELGGGNLELIDDTHDLIVNYDGDVNRLRSLLCRAALIKRVWVVEQGNEHKLLELDRSRYRALRRGIESGSLTIDLRIARLLVNLARVKEGSTFLDPFVGSGTIAHEALMLGAHVIGIDINYKLLHSMRDGYIDSVNSDSTLSPIRDGAVDSIATDPPYNRLSIIDRDLEMLYREFANEAYRVLRVGGYVAFSHPTYVNALDLFLNLGFELVGSGLQYVHGGLSRLIYVFKKPG